MITIYSGFPGSGKSLKVAQDILHNIRHLKRDVIVINMSVNPDYACRNASDGKLLFCPTYSDMYTPEPLYSYALKNHEKGIEAQTLVVFDEVQELLSTDTVKAQKNYYPDYIKDWLTFFSQHRHLGYEIILITQYDRLIHPHIRYLIENEYRHKKVENAGDFGFFLSSFFWLVFRKKLFIQVKTWRGSKEKIGSSFYTFSKKNQKLYDSYKKFEDLLQEESKIIKHHNLNKIDFNKQKEYLENEHAEEKKQSIIQTIRLFFNQKVLKNS